jgi:2-polyprenyl-3-methyl-5-hydroxy-6-metoxy-1,4-benzoquinol methylase
MSLTTARVLKPELMDHADAAEAAVCLRDLARINRWFGGHRVLLQVLRKLVQPGRRFSILDVGAASGDMGRVIRAHFPGAMVVSLDYRASHLRLGQGPRVAANAFQLPFLPGSFDFVLCSLFLHHFSDSQAAELIATLRQVARSALIVLDLERHPLPYYFLPATRRLLRWSPMTVHDGVISVAAAFRPEEIRDLVRAAGATVARVRRHRPWFRLSAIIPAGAQDR